MGRLNINENNFQLPSRGLAYDLEKVPLINGDSITIRPLTAGDLRYLSSVGPDTHRAYIGLLSRVVVAPENLPFDELLLDDINALLFAVRIRSFGPEYTIGFRCNECDTAQTQEILLTDALSRDAEEIEDFKANDITVQLTAHKVTAHLACLKDEAKATKLMKELKAFGKIQNEDVDRAYVRLATYIDTIDDKRMPPKVCFEFLDNSAPGDPEALGAALNERAVGLLPTQPIACNSCGTDNEVRLVITPAFFRAKPTKHESNL
jgi:hypothetical protein